jgi:hypoxanthine phosphoribosyltransferase
MKSYDYAQREGFRTIAWEEFIKLSDQLAEKLDKAGVELIIGVARAGLLPATTVALSLRKELYPIHLTRRVNDTVIFEKPVWRVPVPEEVAGKTVAVVDEIADSGQTLAMVCQSVLEKGAKQVISACLVSHSWANPMPDIALIISDELILFPWDAKVLINGEWQEYPEIVAAIKAQENKGKNANNQVS